MPGSILSTGFDFQRLIFCFRTKGFVNRTQHCVCSHRRGRGNIHPPSPINITFRYLFINFILFFLTSVYRGLQVIRCGRCCASSSSPFVFCNVRLFTLPLVCFLSTSNSSCFYVRLGFIILTRICLHIFDRLYCYLISEVRS